MVMSRLTNARINRANVPTAAASEGVKKPAMIPPTTTKKTIRTHMISGNVRIRAFQVDLSDWGAILGSIFAHPKIMNMKKSAMRRPGRIPARKSFPMDCSVIIP